MLGRIKMITHIADIVSNKGSENLLTSITFIEKHKNNNKTNVLFAKHYLEICFQ